MASFGPIVLLVVTAASIWIAVLVIEAQGGIPFAQAIRFGMGIAIGFIIIGAILVAVVGFLRAFGVESAIARFVDRLITP
jgi:hypothetical protein